MFAVQIPEMKYYITKLKILRLILILLEFFLSN